jgi:hypothetical protein
MTIDDQLTRHLQLLVRWTARLLSVLAAGLVLVFLIGEPRPNHAVTFSLGLKLQFTAFFGVIVGLLAAWRWEWQGAAASLLALAAFNAIEYASIGRLARGAFPYFAIPAVLYLLSASIESRFRSPDPAPNGS